MEKVEYINVAVALPVFNTFTYRVPAVFSGKVKKCSRVLVPFGKRTVTGYVMDFTHKPEGKIKIKDIIEPLDESALFPLHMKELFYWISDYYIYPIGEVIQFALPGGINISEKSYIKPSGKKFRDLDQREKKILAYIGNSVLKSTLLKNDHLDVTLKELNLLKERELVIEEKEIRKAPGKKKKVRTLKLKQGVSTDGLTPKRKEIVEYLRGVTDETVESLKKRFPTISNFIKPLEEKGYIEVFEKEIYRDPFGEDIEPDKPKVLNGEQEIVVAEVKNALGKGFKSFLLSGVTGSGKTEVYMQIAEKAMDMGFNVIVLVPEISLISQTERRFRARFGEKTAILHSGLSHGERYDQWRKILRGEVTISIGVRSSVFAPFKNPGLIIVDEEHDQSYKQDSTLRYNARDLAVVRGKFSDCPVLLGSATPSIQSLYNAENGKFTELVLKNRVNKMPLPDINLIDLKKYRDYRGFRKYVSDELLYAIKDTLKKGEQVMLFLNRRGFSTYPVCSECGEAVKCMDCETTLTLHKNINAYRCHLCGFSKASVLPCDRCGSDKVKQLGFGTEKIEEFMSKSFPDARIARLDQDTVKAKNSMVKILKKVRDHTVDILIGTQMIAKGHDFPKITLVGILCADMSLNFPDFRSSERTYQLLAQVAGRSGRGDSKGHVILQTYTPEHFTVKSAKVQDYRKFYEKEIFFRKSLLFPPLTRMIQLKISGKNPQNVKINSMDLGFFCNELKRSFSKNSIDILGPVEAPLSKVAGRYRWQILLKSVNSANLNRFVRTLKDEYFHKLKSGVRITIDVDPFTMM